LILSLFTIIFAHCLYCLFYPVSLSSTSSLVVLLFVIVDP
jgi:hypothetical protein